MGCQVWLIEIKEYFTKREVLAIIAKLFDPAGWLGPIIITAKMLIQQIWREKTDWDKCLTSEPCEKDAIP